MQTWLDENCGADGWLLTPAGLRGVVNDAVAIYFIDATLAAAFVARWCRHRLSEIAEGAYVMREDDLPTRRRSRLRAASPGGFRGGSTSRAQTAIALS